MLPGTGCANGSTRHARQPGPFAMSPTSIFAPLSTPAESIFELSILVLAIAAAIFVIVAALLVYSVVKFRRKRNDDGREPAQVYGSLQVELAWTITPVIIVLVLFLASARVVFANELHVPVGMRTFLNLLSADTDHSFWVPRLAGKTDLIPNHPNRMWIEPRETGLYLGQCAQYCGTQHAKMLLRVYVDSREDFDRWARQQAAAARDDHRVAQGRRIFEQTACINCHTVSGTAANGRFGPDLTHLMSRGTLGAGVASNTPENLRAWIRRPDDFKPGSLMPPMGLSESQLDAVTAYLSTLQ